MTSQVNSFAEAMIMVLLDDKNLTHHEKTVTKNITVPMFEFIEQQPTPEKRMQALEVIVRMLAMVGGFAIHSSIKEGRYGIAIEELKKSLDKNVHTAIEVFETTMQKAKSQMP